MYRFRDLPESDMVEMSWDWTVRV